MKKGKLFAAGTAVVAVVFIAGMAVVRVMGGKETQTVSTPPYVETITPQTADIRLYTSLLGDAEPEQSAVIHPETGGTILEVFVKAGDEISAGQAICMIDTKQVENARNTMENAQVAYQEAETELGRMTPLYQGGFISDQDYEQYTNAVQKAQIALRQASDEYKRQYSYSNVTAPISGRIEMCGVEALERVSAENTICVISGEGNKMVSTALTEKLRKSVSVGDTVQAEKNGEQYEGTVTEISEMADPTTGLYEMKLCLPDTADIAMGSSIRLEICSSSADSVLTVPVDAVSYENSLPYLYTYDNGTVHKVFIETGIYDSERIEVKSGLTTDEEVIVTWSPELYEGAEVLKADQDESETGKGENK